MSSSAKMKKEGAPSSETPSEKLLIRPFWNGISWMLSTLQENILGIIRGSGLGTLLLDLIDSWSRTLSSYLV